MKASRRTGKRSSAGALETISAGVFERELDAVRAIAASPNAGIFGPASMTWRIDRESAIFLGAGRALLLQLAHPWVAAAIAEHSPAIADPIGRFHRTFNTVFTMVFGTLDQALTAARRLHNRHAQITGTLPAAAGPFAAGSRYAANEPAALRWVHATLVESAVLAHNLVCPPLTGDEREQYWAEARLFGALFGLRPADLPRDWHSFEAYTDDMMRSNVLTVSDAAREIANQLFCGAATRRPTPAWYRALTAEMLPPRLRAEFGLVHEQRERESARRALVWLRRVYPMLPSALRTVGPYQEAVARLHGRSHPGITTQLVNQFWIGRTRMDSG
ncbi:MAG: DUF2236 domain-containing protein [Alphaproteobacteria bacterium]|nr:DUF2236 domain-containing protein [Alphaproteobacteria bacterium]